MVAGAGEGARILELRLKAYEEFRERLMSGALKPGQFLTQRELAKLVGVPLSAAREAIQRLELESLLKVHPQRGVQVASASGRQVRTAYQFRLVLEREAVRSYIASVPIDEMKRMEQATQRIVQQAEQTVTPRLQEEAVEIDWRMHDAFIDSMDNEIIAESYRINAARIRLMRGAGNRLPAQRILPALNEHLAILSACIARDVAGAIEHLEHHINTSQRHALDDV